MTRGDKPKHMEQKRPKGLKNDHVLSYMQENGIELTRENYLELAYFGNVPEDFGPELEAELPEQFRIKE